MSDKDIIPVKIRAIRGIAGLLMIHQGHDLDCQAAEEAIWNLAREIEEKMFEEEASPGGVR